MVLLLQNIFFLIDTKLMTYKSITQYMRCKMNKGFSVLSRNFLRLPTLSSTTQMCTTELLPRWDMWHVVENYYAATWHLVSKSSLWWRWLIGGCFHKALTVDKRFKHRHMCFSSRIALFVRCIFCFLAETTQFDTSWWLVINFEKGWDALIWSCTVEQTYVEQNVDYVDYYVG